MERIKLSRQRQARRGEQRQACITANVFERAPQRSISYLGFVDPSGGSSDSMTLCIGHIEHARETAVIDALREVKPPF
jgi:hypothetical protein